MNVSWYRVNLRRALQGDPRSVVVLYDQAFLLDALARSGLSPIPNSVKAINACVVFLDRSQRDIMEYSEQDRDFVTRDLERFADSTEIQEIELLMQKCIERVDCLARGEYPVPK